MSGPGLTGYDAVILAGGRSSRLGGEPKAELVVEGETLLLRTLHAVRDAACAAVVGPPSLAGALSRSVPAPVLVREEPPFSGPAAAMGAGIAAIGRRSDGSAATRRPWTLVLACDMPEARSAVPVLLAAADQDPGRSVLARDGAGKTQPLAGLYRTDALLQAVAGGPESLVNLSMFSMLARVQWREVAVPEGSTADVDTWDDARKWGIMPRARAAPSSGPAAAAKE
ncbi:molybdenum cofactor guanylyltransferase [Arthrobacter gandavensis]|uniref:molybdenum cofactor guanylyltransferase n=1 Tax=Arthrobacter gandavensis TaxID=169960 RepID=UPI001E417D81|nr:NTP transferase domain-containing protein [Arthrobacter gandavensis]